MGAIADTDEETEFPEEVRQKTRKHTKKGEVLQPMYFILPISCVFVLFVVNRFPLSHL